MKLKDIIRINEKTYALVPGGKCGEGEKCDDCALVKECRKSTECICHERFGNEYSFGKRFVEVENDGTLTEEKAYEDYQERSQVSGERADMLAWMMGGLLFGQLIGGSKYVEFYVLGGMALLYMLLSVMQAVWQTVTMWVIKCRIKRTGVNLYDYPDWVGFGAWVFYWLKMNIIAIGAIYGAIRFLWFAM